MSSNCYRSYLALLTRCSVLGFQACFSCAAVLSYPHPYAHSQLLTCAHLRRRLLHTQTHMRRHSPEYNMLVAFGGYNGKYHNAVSVYKLPNHMPQAAPQAVERQAVQQPQQQQQEEVKQQQQQQVQQQPESERQPAQPSAAQVTRVAYP